MARFKRKISWKKILSGILVGVLLLGAVGLGITIFGNDRENVSNWGYAIGDLDSHGAYKEDTQHIYMKERFACKGLRVEPKFDNVHTYQLFFYDYDGEFLECTEEGMTKVFTDKDVPIGAYYCRMVIAPDIAKDVNKDKFEIKFWEVLGYADDFTVSVYKDQTPVNYFEVEARDMKATVQDGACVYVEEDGVGHTEEIDVTKISQLRLIFNGDSYSTSYVQIYADGTAQSFTINAGNPEVTINLTGGPEKVVFNYEVGEQYAVIATRGIAH